MNLISIGIQDGLGCLQVVFADLVAAERFRKYQRDFIDLIDERDAQDDRIKVLTAELNAAYAVAKS